jgi:hypothetical protein
VLVELVQVVAITLLATQEIAQRYMLLLLKVAVEVIPSVVQTNPKVVLAVAQ